MKIYQKNVVVIDSQFGSEFQNEFFNKLLNIFIGCIKISMESNHRDNKITYEINTPEIIKKLQSTK